MPESEIRLEIERLAAEKGTKVWHVSKPMLVKVGDVVIKVTPPSKSVLSSGDENDTSLYITVQYGKFSAAFTGDMSTQSELDLIAQGDIEDIDVLKVAHHGSQTATSNEFITAAAPEFALIGVGENNEYAHPHDEVLSRLSSSEILRTDTDGDIVRTSDREGHVAVKTEK